MYHSDYYIEGQLPETVVLLMSHMGNSMAAASP